MNITETVNQELRREYRIVIPATDLDQKLNGKIEEIKPRMNLKGFRPGKAPISYLKKTFGKQMMGEIVKQAVNELNQQALHEGPQTLNDFYYLLGMPNNGAGGEVGWDADDLLRIKLEPIMHESESMPILALEYLVVPSRSVFRHH